MFCWALILSAANIPALPDIAFLSPHGRGQLSSEQLLKPCCSTDSPTHKVAAHASATGLSLYFPAALLCLFFSHYHAYIRILLSSVKFTMRSSIDTRFPNNLPWVTPFSFLEVSPPEQAGVTIRERVTLHDATYQLLISYCMHSDFFSQQRLHCRLQFSADIYLLIPFFFSHHIPLLSNCIVQTT